MRIRETNERAGDRGPSPGARCRLRRSRSIYGNSAPASRPPSPSTQPQPGQAACTRRNVRRSRSSRPAYFTDAELARLWPELEYRQVILALAKTAVMTGAGFGELAQRSAGPTSTSSNRELHVSRTWTPNDGGDRPRRAVRPARIDLTPQAAKVLETWYAKSDADGTGLVFPRDDGRATSSTSIARPVASSALSRRLSGPASRVSANAGASETFTRSGIRSRGSRSRGAQR